jgi:hypothetical protein
MDDKNIIRMDYNYYISSINGPDPSLKYYDYSVTPLSHIGAKFNQLLNARINDIEISKTDLKKIKKYFKGDKRKPLENLLAASYFLYTSGSKIRIEDIEDIFDKRPKFVENYKKKLNASKLLYEKIGTEPRINSNVIDYDLLK